jgi:nicotinamide mononucleotide (NMN) deamidase PncC
MESVVGELLQKKSLSIAVYEDLTGGMLAERLRQANADGFKEGIIGGTGSVQRVLSQIRGDGGADGSPQDDVVLTERLASAVRAWSGADLGLASHGVTDDKAERENLSSGRTYVSLAGEQGVVNRMYEFAGTGRPDRLRASFNALEFLRQALLD